MADEYPRSLADVNRAVRSLGVRFYRQPTGYYYPVALDGSWVGEGVYVNNCTVMKLDFWVKEAKEQRGKHMRKAADDQLAKVDMEIIRSEAEKKGFVGRNWFKAIKMVLQAGGGIVKVLGFKGNSAEISTNHPYGHGLGVVTVPVLALRMASRRASTLPSGMYHTIQMVQPWTDAYGNPAQEYMGADGQQMQPLRRRPDYGEREMDITERVMAMGDDEFVDRDTVAQLCPTCASKMKREGMRALRASIVKQAIRNFEAKKRLSVRDEAVKAAVRDLRKGKTK